MISLASTELVENEEIIWVELIIESPICKYSENSKLGYFSTNLRYFSFDSEGWILIEHFMSEKLSQNFSIKWINFSWYCFK